jgi:predicted O-methyltransferase YrrM
MHLQTLSRIAQKSIRHPFRAVRNGIYYLRMAMLDLESERERLFSFLQSAFHADTDALRAEFEASDYAPWMAKRRAELVAFPGPYRFGSAEEWDCEALYYLIRALKPRMIVETGVCYGASSSYILYALARNGMGELHSIDLGNTPDEPPNHFFVHPKHRDRWHLIIGDSTIELPRLLKRLGQIDLFHHDSLHKYEHMMWEYTTAFPHLTLGGVLSSDDVNSILTLRQAFQRGPFADFCDRHGWMWQTFRNFGIAIDPSPAAMQTRWQHLHRAQPRRVPDPEELARERRRA